MRKIIIFIILITLAVRVDAQVSAGEILERVINLYSNLKTYQDSTKVIISLTSQGIENKVSYISDVFIDKPNKFFIKSRSEIYGRTLISDGRNMWLHIPSMNKYIENNAPVNLENILTVDLNNITTMGSRQFLLFLFFNKENKFLKEIAASTYGEEIINERFVDIIDLKNKTLNIQLWVDRENNTIIKISLDATSIIKNQQKEMGVEPAEIKMIYQEIHSNICVDKEINNDIFKFAPPEGATPADSFYEGDSQLTNYPYLGKKSIDFELKSVNKKGKIKLSEYYGNIILLAFLESNKKTSIHMIKDLQNIFNIYKNEELSVFGIDIKGNEKSLKKLKIKFPVLIDEENNLSNSYSVNSYPTLFIIDENGIIKHVYTAYFTEIEERLKKDINLLLEEMDKVKDSTETKGLYRLWHLPVKTTGLSANSFLTAISVSGDMYLITPQGSIKKIIKLKNKIQKILPLNSDRTKYIGYSLHRRDVIAFNAKDEELWKIKIEPGINDIEIGNLDSDNYPEIGIGTSGLEGINVIDHKGATIWNSTDIINVIKLEIADFTGDNSSEICAVSNDGNIYIFNNKGKLIDTLKPQIYATYIKIIKSSELLISGSSDDNEILKVLDNKGKVMWEVILGNAESSRVEDVKVHPFKNIIALSTADGQVFVFDNIGNIISYTKEKGFNITIDWLITETGQTNLVTAGIESGINNYLLIDGE